MARVRRLGARVRGFGIRAAGVGGMWWDVGSGDSILSVVLGVRRSELL